MEITLELSDPVVMQSKHTMSHVFHKIFGNWKTMLSKLESNKIAIARKKIMNKRGNQLILSLLSKTLILK